MRARIKPHGQVAELGVLVLYPLSYGRERPAGLEPATPPL